MFQPTPIIFTFSNRSSEKMGRRAGEGPETAKQRWGETANNNRAGRRSVPAGVSRRREMSLDYPFSLKMQMIVSS